MKPGAKKIDKALDQLMFEKTKLDAGITSLRLEEIWREIMPEDVTDYTKSVKYSKGVLKIQITSSSLRQNLLYKKEDILLQINELLKSNKVKSLKIN